MRPLTIALLVIGLMSLCTNAFLWAAGITPTTFGPRVLSDMSYVILVLLLWQREKEIDHG